MAGDGLPSCSPPTPTFTLEPFHPQPPAPPPPPPSRRRRARAHQQLQLLPSSAGLTMLRMYGRAHCGPNICLPGKKLAARGDAPVSWAKSWMHTDSTSAVASLSAPNEYV